ncbi:MAG: HD domain-containing protein, partial [Abditibacteriaceae bacterium]
MKPANPKTSKDGELPFTSSSTNSLENDHAGYEATAKQTIRALITKTQDARTSSDAALLERAFAFASEQHIDQKRMSGEPYIEHPIAVAGILAELGMDDVS